MLGPVIIGSQPRCSERFNHGTFTFAMMLRQLPQPLYRSRLLLRKLSSSSGTPRVTTRTDKDGICEVVLNRPDKLNSCDMNMFHAIAQTASLLREDRSVRAVILRGEGRAFCTGLDVKSVMNSNPLKQIEALLERPSGYGKANNEIGNLAQDVSYLWRELPVPVICVIHGMCYGAGLQIALGADFRYTRLSTFDNGNEMGLDPRHEHCRYLTRTREDRRGKGIDHDRSYCGGNRSSHVRVGDQSLRQPLERCSGVRQRPCQEIA
jgi:Enoyl-CoA hydratase/isomerase